MKAITWILLIGFLSLFYKTEAQAQPPVVPPAKLPTVKAEPSLPLRHTEGKQYKWHINVDAKGNFYREGKDEWHTKGNSIDFGTKDYEAEKTKKPEQWKADLKEVEKVEVISVAEGKITRAVTHKDGRGGEVVIKHADGTEATYMHIKIKEGIRGGIDIKQGEPIGVVAAKLPPELRDKEGNLVIVWTGPHLHFQIDPPEKAKDFSLEGKKLGDFKAGEWYFSRHNRQKDIIKASCTTQRSNIADKTTKTAQKETLAEWLRRMFLPRVERPIEDLLPTRDKARQLQPAQHQLTPEQLRSLVTPSVAPVARGT